MIDSLHADALAAIKERGRDEEVGDADDVAEKVALGALHYYMLQATPIKDMLFNPAESLSFNGNTGPYLQYMGARVFGPKPRDYRFKLNKKVKILARKSAPWKRPCGHRERHQPSAPRRRP